MNVALEASVYNKHPLKIQDGIPVFSDTDRYVANYQKIASDHVASMKPGHNNPFIGEALWLELERSTRTLVERYAPAGSRVLDVGVGLGRLLGPLAQYERCGIDISFDYLKRARETGIEVAFSRIEDMPYADESFDLVMVTDVLEHVFDLHHCTREILRVLKPGGALVIRVPYKEDLEVYLSEDLPYEFIHLRAFDEASLRLHFSKIFGMKFLEAAPVAPYLQGLPRLKVQLLKEAERQALTRVTSVASPKWAVLKRTLEVSAEEFMNWIYALRDDYPQAYEEVASELVLGIEINAVFRK